MSIWIPGGAPGHSEPEGLPQGRRARPDWRFTCFFLGRERRGEVISPIALRNTIHQISRLGDGTVEAYSQDYVGQKVSRSFLCSGTKGMFEKAGFERTRKIAMHRRVVQKKVPGKAPVASPKRTPCAPARRRR